jgi:hypothetical protein
VFVAASAAFILISSDAQAVMRGRAAGGISRHVVKLIGHNLLCTATVVGRQQVLTANHCVEGQGPFFVVAAGRQIPVTGHTPSGQTTLLTLGSPLPATVEPIATGSAQGDGVYTIAGFGTAVESTRMHSAGLREARLVNDPRFNALVDPHRHGAISASACMGDSGGPVARFDGKRYVLVGIVERVSNYSGIGACGFLTHYSTFGGVPSYAAEPANSRQASEPRHAGRRIKQWAGR